MADAKVCPDCGRLFYRRSEAGKILDQLPDATPEAGQAAIAAKLCFANDERNHRAKSECLTFALARERTAHEETRRALEAARVRVQKLAEKFEGYSKKADESCAPGCCSSAMSEARWQTRALTWGHAAAQVRQLLAAALGPQKPAAPVVWERVTDREASTPLPIGMGSIGIAHETRADGILLHVFASTLAAAKAKLERIVRAAGLLPEAAPQDKEKP